MVINVKCKLDFLGMRIVITEEQEGEKKREKKRKQRHLVRGIKDGA